MEERGAAKAFDLDVIHPSLTRPVLWGGVERRVVGIEFLITVLLITWRGMAPGTLAVVACIVIPIHLIARRVARADPRMFDLFLRNLTWRQHYAPHAPIRVVAAPAKPSIPGRK